MLELEINWDGPAPQESFVPRRSFGASSLLSGLRPADMSRPELLEALTFEEYQKLLVRRRYTLRQAYARWCIRRVLSQFETVRRTNGRIFHLSRGGHMRATGKPSKTPTLLADGRLMRDLPEVLTRYGCPREHLESAERLIRARLAQRWAE
jgi:hypothetical protein